MIPYSERVVAALLVVQSVKNRHDRPGQKSTSSGVAVENLPRPASFGTVMTKLTSIGFVPQPNGRADFHVGPNLAFIPFNQTAA